MEQTEQPARLVPLPDKLHIVFEDGMFLGAFIEPNGAIKLEVDRLARAHKLKQKIQIDTEQYVRVKPDVSIFEDDDPEAEHYKSRVKRLSTMWEDEPRSRIIERCVKAQCELEELEHTFRLVHDAHQRGIDAWRAEKPQERELRQPDTGDMTKWLLDKLTRVRELVEKGPEPGDYDGYDHSMALKAELEVFK